MGRTLDEIFADISEFYQKSVDEMDAKGFGDLYKASADALIEQMKEAGFTPTDIEFLDGYYVFGMGTNSVLNFKVKECPGWLFGVWWEEPEKEINDLKGVWFCQYEATIDKFKPSASNITNTLEITVDSHDLDWYFEKTLIYIRDEPYLAFCRDYYGWDYNYEYHTRDEAKMKFEEWYTKNELTAQGTAEYAQLKRDLVLELLKNAREDGESIYIYDGGECISPRYEFYVHIVDGEEGVTHLSDFEGYDELANQLNALKAKYEDQDVWIDTWTYSDWVKFIKDDLDVYSNMEKVL